MSSDLVKIDTDRGEVALSKEIVRRYFCPTASDSEIDMFLKLCVYQKLNPFLRQAYLVKYGTQPATLVVGWQVFLERAEKNPAFDGYEVEVFDDQDAPYRGRPSQKISHATAKVYRKDRRHPVTVTVLFSEYCVKNANGQPMSSWAKIPVTMIRKVALEQALREAFTKEFVGMYGPEEMGITEVPEDEVVIEPAGTETIIEGLDEPPAPEEEDVTERVASHEPVAVPSSPPAAHPAGPRVITPITAVKFLTNLYGAAWPRAMVKGKSVGEHYFGVPLKTNNELFALQKANKAAWDAGIRRLLADAEGLKARSS